MTEGGQRANEEKGSWSGLKENLIMRKGMRLNMLLH